MDHSITKRAYYRILGVASEITMTLRKRTELIKAIGINNFNNIQINAASEPNMTEAERLYDYFVETGNYGMIELYMEVILGHINANEITVCDPYSSDLTWLKTFGDFISERDRKNSKINLISGQVEDDEEVSYYPNHRIPKNSISLMLYDSKACQKSASLFLRELVEQQHLHDSRGTQNFYNGRFIAILTQQEIADNLMYILQNFEIAEESCHSIKINNQLQHVLFGVIKSDSVDISCKTERTKLETQFERLMKIVKTGADFNTSVYGMWATELPNVPFEEMVAIMEEETAPELIVSDLDNSNWEWIKGITTTQDTRVHKHTKPTPLKTGEVANIIASGMVNGELCAGEDGEHIVVGGTTERTIEENEDEITKNGKIKARTKTTKYSEPYLNILTSVNGKAKIKQLQGEENLL